VAAALFFSPDRIPIGAEEQIEAVTLDVSRGVMELFPLNMFGVLAGDGVFLLPFYVFAFFLGMGLSYDKNHTKPVIALVDSLSRVFFHIASFFIEILGFIIIVLSAYWAVAMREALRAEVFTQLIVMLGILAGVLGFVVLPLFLYLLKPKTNPWKTVYASLGPAITAFFSGDVNFSLPVMIRHAKESLGVRRRSAALTLAMFSTFCRAGSAMVAAVAFIVVFNSYTHIGITAPEVVSVVVQALIISFLLARHPGNGAYAALAIICLGFGGGFEGGYLILRPIAFYLIAIGTFLDVMIAFVANYAMARINGFTEDKEVRRYI